jgi:hypothetical protein
LFKEINGKSADETPSRRENMSPSDERLHRLHGSSLLLSAWTRLLQKDYDRPIGASCYSTSCVLFHRYLHRVSLSRTDVWSAAMGCALLASKLHDNLKISPSRVAKVFYNLYLRRILIFGCASNAELRGQIAAHPSVSCLSVSPTSNTSHEASELNRLRTVLSAPGSELSPAEPILQDWIGAVVDAESDVLRQLGFVVYWITGQLAHKYLPYFLDLIISGDIDDGSREGSALPVSGASASKEQVARRAWSYCNDSYRLDLATRFHPSVVACAAIHLSLIDSVSADGGADLGEGSRTPVCWWDRVAETDNKEDVSVVCNALLGLQESFDAKVAALGFVSSVGGVAFNDPNSVSWQQAKKQMSIGQASS